eukprot:COSAG05_NODE_284_length_12237_cov_15.252266_7_plen_97_part_00
MCTRRRKLPEVVFHQNFHELVDRNLRGYKSSVPTMITVLYCPLVCSLALAGEGGGGWMAAHVAVAVQVKRQLFHFLIINSATPMHARAARHMQTQM